MSIMSYIIKAGCGRLMANGDYWGLMGIYFHSINLNGDYWGSSLIPMTKILLDSQVNSPNNPH